MKKCEVGGQAVIEGVMMRGSKGLATAVRKEDGDIEVKVENIIPVNKKYPILNIPFLRGIFVLIDSLKTGMESLNYSASFFEDTEESKFENWLRSKLGDKTNDVVMGFTMVLSLVIAMTLFISIPTVITNLFKVFNLPNIALNFIEAFIRIIILILYIWGVSNLEDIYRVFQYHGAEHKTIFCYEAGEELTIENVRKQSRFHPRCGTNFLFLVMFVSVLVFSFTGWGSIVERLILRILLLPVVTGITYELIKWLGKSNSKLSEIIAWPGLQLQRLTTREPDDEEIEVAIASLLAAEGLEEPEKTIAELLDMGTKKLKEANIDTARLDAQLILGKVLGKDKIYLITEKDKKVLNVDKKVYLKYINKRKNKMPVKYILGETDFYGLDFYVEEGVLIPRGDTEILVEEVLKLIPLNSEDTICDLCCGSGAIGIALAYNRSNIKVDSIDYYEVPEKVTKKNIERNNLQDRVTFIKSDLLKEVIELDKKYTAVVSNPPYIKDVEIEKLMEDVKDYEPRTALSGGEDGLKFYRRIVEESKKVLQDNGILAFEIGHDQGEDVKNMMLENSFKNVKVIKDLAKHDRVVIGTFNID